MKYNIKNIILLIFFIVSYSVIRKSVQYFLINDFVFLDLLSDILFNIVIIMFPLLLIKIRLRIYLIPFFILLSLSNFAAIVHLFQYKTPISMGAFAAIAETSSQETLEFFNILSLGKWLLAFFLSIFPIVFLFFIKKKFSLSRKNVFFIVVISLFAAFFSSSVKNKLKYHNFVIYRDFSFEPSFIYKDAKRIRYYLQEKKKLSGLIKNRSKLSYKVSEDTCRQKRIFVLIIGESMARGHLSIYGYRRETTPLLKNLDSLLIYKDVISSATQTSPNIIRMLSQATVQDKSPFYNKGSIINLAENAGYKTYWISNQQMLGISDTETSVIAEDSEELFFLNTDWTTNSSDEKIFPKLDSVLSEKNEKKFIVIHLLGNHFAYEKRYPKKQRFIIKDRFNYPKYLNKHQIDVWNHYDNSLRYTDYIITTIIEKIRQQKEISSVLYLSDHGEEVYDDENTVLGHGRQIVKPQVIEIPFLLWNSQYYYKSAGYSYDKLVETCNRPYCSENLFFGIADLLNINFSEQNLSKSLFSDAFIPEKRFIINSENKVISYDEIKK